MPWGDDTATASSCEHDVLALVELPYHVIMSSLRKLDVHDLVTVMGVCKKLNEMAHTNGLWLRLYSKNWPKLKKKDKTVLSSAKF